MIKIWSLKKGEEQANKTKKSKVSPAEIRVQKDITELDLPDTIKIHIPDPSNKLVFTITISPDQGIYKGGIFPFSFVIGSQYPHEAPKVKCVKKIYHPNIDLEGNVCLNILREDWKPVLNVNAILIGLQYLFLEPNPDDPLNKAAAEELKRDRNKFVNDVKKSMAGGYVIDQSYDDVLVEHNSE